jgi:hypothetical protein
VGGLTRQALRVYVIAYVAEEGFIGRFFTAHMWSIECPTEIDANTSQAGIHLLDGRSDFIFCGPMEKHRIARMGNNNLSAASTSTSIIHRSL